MNKNYILIVIVALLSLSVVNAKVTPTNLLDKRLIDIDNCYNLTITVEQTRGVASPIYFNGCTITGNNTWFCNCRTDTNNWVLVAKSDNTILRDERVYSIFIDARVYDFEKGTIKLKMEDWGDYATLTSKKFSDFDDDIEEVIIISYVNRTQYVDKVEYVNVTRNFTVEVPVEVNVTTYIENITRIKELEENIKKARVTISWLATIIFMIILMTLIFGVYKLFKPRG